jgi:uncharacterized protein
MFPLNSVLFPGLVVPLHVFEERYRALVQHLHAIPDTQSRLFGSVGIREGYEIGDHGAQSLFRVGCRLQLTDVTSNPDGTFDIQAVCRDRIRLDRLDTSAEFPEAAVTMLPVSSDSVSPQIVARAVAVFDTYRDRTKEIRPDPVTGPLPGDPEVMSWVMAAAAPLSMPDRQSLLETDETELRLAMLTDLIRAELRAVRAIPSLPATEVARTRWSPN